MRDGDPAAGPPYVWVFPVPKHPTDLYFIWLAILGRFPFVKLLTRKDACGNPCQLCKQKKCGIDAIEQDGSIDYAECIQCLECVVTLDNPDLCKIDKYKKKKVPTRVKNLNPVRT